MLHSKTEILTVDDSATMRKIIRLQLAELGLRSVYEAAHGQQAIDMMHNWTPHVILSDFDMTPVNGAELLAHIRADRRLGRVPFVMVSAHAVRFADSGRDGGITHYLAKPFRPENLKEKISAVLSAARLRAA